MSISLDISSFIFNDVDVETRDLIASILPYKMDPLSTGFKYLGYHLNPLGYHTNDWRWIINMFEKESVTGPIDCYHLVEG